MNVELEHKIDNLVMSKISEHGPDIRLDKKQFFDYFKWSLALNAKDKYKMLKAIPTLSQFQFNELLKVFKMEKEKFEELSLQDKQCIDKHRYEGSQEWLKLITFLN